MIKKLEALANLAVIITSVVVCTVLVKRYLLPSNANPAVAAATGPVSEIASSSRKRSIAPGTKISLPGIDWSKTERTLLLALSTTCHFCSESAPFYQKLEQEKRDGVRLVALFPQPLLDSRTYLDNLGLKIDEVVQSPLNSVGASGTPTLLLIDNQGTVINSWVGKLSDGAAEEVKLRVSK